MKKLIAVLLIICTLTLSGCGIRESIDNAKIYSDDFVKSLADVEKMKSLLHVDYWLEGEEVNQLIAQIEKTNDIDFSNGVEIVDCNWNSWTGFDGIHNGSVHQHTYKLEVSGKVVTMFVIVVDNNVDYGVMYFGIYDPELE